MEIQTSIFQMRISCLSTVKNYTRDKFSEKFEGAESKFIMLVVFELFNFVV